MLTAEAVEKIFTDCLFKAEEIIDGKPIVEPVKTEGVMLNVGFHPERLEKYKDEIISLLECLPKQFMQEYGGGWTFLNACVDNEDNQWGEHHNIDQLISLGIAIGKVAFLMPRPMWSAFPGGMPYFVVKKVCERIKASIS